MFVSRNEKDKKKSIFDKSNYSLKLMNIDEYNDFKNENSVEELNNLVNPNTPEGILTAPRKMYFDLTNKCNLRCKTCHNDSWKANPDELSTDESMETLLGLREQGVFQVKFSGGELTQREDWFEIVDFAKDLNFVFGINTNGVYDSQTLDKILRLNPDDVNVSIDGWEETNDKIRGLGIFDKVTNTVKELRSYGCNVSVNSLLSNITTKEDINKLCDFGNTYNVDVDFFHVRPMGRAKRYNLSPTFERLHELYDFIRNNKELPKNRNPLLDGIEVFNIIPNGDIYAGGCVPYISEKGKIMMKLGNIVEEDYDISSVWSSSKLNKIRERYEKENNKCLNCNNNGSSCNGATAEMLLYKELYKSNPFCKLNL